MKYGAYTFGIVFFLGILLQFVGIPTNLVQNLVFLVLGAEMFFCCQEYKHRTQEPLSFAQAFGMSWQVSFFAGIAMGLFSFFIIQISGSEEIIKSAMEHKEMFMQQTGGSAEDAETLIKTIFNPWTLFFLLVLLHAIFGFFLSFLIAFLARTPQLPPQNEI